MCETFDWAAVTNWQKKKAAIAVVDGGMAMPKSPGGPRVNLSLYFAKDVRNSSLSGRGCDASRYNSAPISSVPSGRMKIAGLKFCGYQRPTALFPWFEKKPIIAVYDHVHYVTILEIDDGLFDGTTMAIRFLVVAISRAS